MSEGNFGNNFELIKKQNLYCVWESENIKMKLFLKEQIFKILNVVLILYTLRLLPHKILFEKQWIRQFIFY